MNSNSIISQNSNLEKSPISKVVPGKFRIVSSKNITSGGMPGFNPITIGSNYNNPPENSPIINQVVDDAMKLKNSINKINTVNYKSEYLKVESELKKKEKLEDVNLFSHNKDYVKNNVTNFPNSLNMMTTSKENNQILSLKNQLKLNMQILKEKEDEIELMKKQNKVTRMNELLLENRALNDELIKIKQFYENSFMNSLINDKDENDMEQSKKLLHKKQKNKKLKEEVKNLRRKLEENDLIYKNIEESHLKLIKKKEKSRILKNELKQQKEQIENLMNKLNDLENTSNAKSEFQSEKVPEENNLNNEITNLKIQIEELKRESEYYKNLSEKREKLLNDIQEQQLNNHNRNEAAYENSLKITLENTQLNKTIANKEKEISDLLQEKENLLTEISNLSKNINANVRMEETAINEEEFCELTYVLSKNFEANYIDMATIQEKLLLKVDINGDQEFSKFEDQIANNIMELLKNRNNGNKEEIIIFMRFFIKTYNINSSNFKDQFCSLFNTQRSYSNESVAYLNEHLKKLLTPYRTQLFNEVRRKDQNNSGYITFFNMRQIVENLKLTFDDDLMEYLIYLMKRFDDNEAFLRDLNHGNLFNLLVADYEIPVEDIRLASNSFSSALISDKDVKTRSESLLTKIAGVLYSKVSNVQKIFHQVIVIEESAKFYTGMYLKHFLKILQNEFLISLDYTDVICIFKRLKNERNVYNIEVIDIDKLIDEMEVFGITCDECEIQPVQPIQQIIEEENIEAEEKVNEENNQEVMANPGKPIIDLLANEDTNEDEKEKVVDKDLEKVNEMIEEINPINEILNYLKLKNLHFKDLSIFSHPFVRKIQNQHLFNLDSFITFLYFKDIISSKNVDIKCLNKYNDNNHLDLINLTSLSHDIELKLETNVNNSNEINKQSEIKHVSGLEIENDFKEEKSKKEARRMTEELFKTVIVFNKKQEIEKIEQNAKLITHDYFNHALQKLNQLEKKNSDSVSKSIENISGNITSGVVGKDSFSIRKTSMELKRIERELDGVNTIEKNTNINSNNSKSSNKILQNEKMSKVIPVSNFDAVYDNIKTNGINGI